MNYPCKLIRDLLPLCHDGIASEESRTAVEAHLAECAACRECYDRLCRADYVERYAYDAEMTQQAAASYRQVRKKSRRHIAWIIVLAVAGTLLASAAPFIGMGMLIVGSMTAKVEVHDDVRDYRRCRSGAQADPEYRDKWGMDESIWPEEITPAMDVQEYRMVYYDPWDAQYLGYLTVRYDAAEYAAECERLRAYPSTEYIGYYGVTGETDYALLAVYADAYQGFVYALTDGEGTIIYAEQIFCNYQMDLDYADYMPEEYFLDGFDATPNNPYEVAMRRR